MARHESIGWLRLGLLAVLVSGLCPAPLARFLHRRVLADPAWASAYHRARRAERAGSDRNLSTGQADLLEQLILSRVAGDASTSTLTSTLTSTSTHASAQTRSGAWAPLAAACAVAVVFVVVGEPPARGTLWTTRGGDDAPRVGMRARCIDKVAQRVVDQAEVGPRAMSDVLRCPHGSLLSFSMTNLEKEPVYVYAVGVTDGGSLRFFSPFEESSTSLRVDANTVDHPLDVVADTGALPDDGGIALFTLFSTHALRGADIARSLRSAGQRAVRVRALDQLPVDALTTRIEMNP